MEKAKPDANGDSRRRDRQACGNPCARDATCGDDEDQARACQNQLRKQDEQISHSRPAIPPLEDTAASNCVTDARRTPSTDSG